MRTYRIAISPAASRTFRPTARGPGVVNVTDAWALVASSNSPSSSRSQAPGRSATSVVSAPTAGVGSEAEKAAAGGAAATITSRVTTVARPASSVARTLTASGPASGVKTGASSKAPSASVSHASETRSPSGSLVVARSVVTIPAVQGSGSSRTSGARLSSPTVICAVRTEALPVESVARTAIVTGPAAGKVQR